MRLILALCFLVLARAAGAEEPASVFGRTPVPAQAAPAPAEAQEPVNQLIGLLDPMQRVSQLMMVTTRGRSAPNMEDFAHLRNLPPGAIIVRSVLRPSDGASYVSRLRALEKGTGVPVWIGANLYRLAERDRGAASAFVQIPSMLSVAAARDTDLARGVSSLIADHVRGMGFDFYLGPSLALAPVVADVPGTIHSFGGDPHWAGTAGAIMNEVLGAAGVLPMPMDFPGGASTDDPRRPTVLLTPAPALDTQDLLPFKQAIEAGAGIIHVGTAYVPTLDPASPPACLSRAVVTGLLRERLGFEGVIVAGPMDSPAITGSMPPDEAAVLALQAGADMLLYDDSGAIIMKAVSRIGKALADGTLSEARLDASLRRILALKVAQRTGRAAPQKAEALDRMSGKRDYVRLVQDVERRSATLVRNTGGMLPLSKARSIPILVTGTTGVQELQKALERHIKPVVQRRIATARHLGRIQDFEITRLTGSIRGVRTIVCVLSSSEEIPGQAELVRGLKGTGANVAVVYLGYPRALPEIAAAGADAILLAYCDSATVGLTMQAVADVLAGEGPVAIRTPVAPPRVPAGEARTYSALEIVHMPAGRLPVHISAEFPLGLAVPYLDDSLVRRAAWDFGDGTTQKTPRVSHAYRAPGRYTVTLEVVDQRKNTVREQFEVEVLP